MADRRRAAAFARFLANNKSGGYGPNGTGSYKPIEDQRGGQAERTAYDQQAAEYNRRRQALKNKNGAARYTKGSGRPS